MEPQDQEPAGDYGYDMAHQDVQRPKAPETPRPAPARPSNAPRPPEPGQDYGYDEAHSF